MRHKIGRNITFTGNDCVDCVRRHDNVQHIMGSQSSVTSRGDDMLFDVKAIRASPSKLSFSPLFFLLDAFSFNN